MPLRQRRDGNSDRQRWGAFGRGMDGRVVIAVTVLCVLILSSAAAAAAVAGGGSGVTVGPRSRPSVKRRVLRGGAEARHSALARADRRIMHRRQRLERPAARAQRQESRMAFHGIGTPAARKLLVHDYGEVFEGASINPAATVESEGKIVRYLNDYSAEVRTPEGMQVKEPRACLCGSLRDPMPIGPWTWI